MLLRSYGFMSRRKRVVARVGLAQTLSHDTVVACKSALHSEYGC